VHMRFTFFPPYKLLFLNQIALSCPLEWWSYGFELSDR
jgi:hypothetical protein